MWIYAQKSGHLFRDGSLVATGYSGSMHGKNCPELEGIRSVGPIPRGKWLIAGPPVTSPRTGPITLTLIPQFGTELFGRDGSSFRMHGDSIAEPGTASEGCIVMPPTTRQAVWDSGDRQLLVIEDDALAPPADPEATPTQPNGG